MQAHHESQPYDVPSSQAAAGDSLWTPAPDAIVRASAPRDDLAQAAINVHGLERLASGLVGGLLLARGIAAHGPLNRLMALVGSALVYRGVSGHCHLYQALGVDTAHHHA